MKKVYEVEYRIKTKVYAYDEEEAMMLADENIENDVFNQEFWGIEEVEDDYEDEEDYE